jgi:hypothetical protein
MVDWKIYIDSPLVRALDLCGGSLTEGDGDGCGSGWRLGNGRGIDYRDGGYSDGWGDGDGYSNGRGGGRSADEW